MLLLILLPFKLPYQLEENRQRDVQPKKKTVVRFLAEEGDFAIFLRVKTLPETQRVCYFLGTAGSFLGQYNVRGMKLAIYIYLMSSIRMNSTTPSDNYIMRLML